MIIIPIFEPGLYVIREHETDALADFLRFATDPERLFKFYTSNNLVLDYYGLNMELAVKQTIAAAQHMYVSLREHAENPSKLFVPLSNKSTSGEPNASKFRKLWLRIYAIGIEHKVYIITGGNIKQSQKMQDHKDTVTQLNRLNRLRALLLEHGITDQKGLQSFIFEQS